VDEVGFDAAAVRIPDGLRENGAVQRAYDFNREVLS